MPTVDKQKMVESFKKRVTRQAALSFSICAHCGMCTDSCHYYLATKDPKMAPAYKADLVRKLYKKHVDWTGRVFPKWVGAKTIESDEQLEEMKEAFFGNCTMCRRCTVNCPMGVDKALLIRTGRALLTEAGIAPEGISQVSEDQWKTGNQMAVSDEDYRETIEWLSDELEAEMGDPKARIPLDKEGANVVYLVNPREVKYAPLSLQAAAKIFYLAGESWTMPGKGWDNTNFGLFSGDNALGGHMGKLAFENVQRLKGKSLVTSECGHGFRATKWESPNWSKTKPDFPIYNFLELLLGYINDGRIKLDPSKNPDPITYHDPCNLGRSSGMTEEPRIILKKACMNFVEMYPNRADNFCCSGGGGAMSMGEYTKRRLEVAKVKADQLKVTKTKICATACHNCIDAITDLIKHYQLGMKTSVVSEIVEKALVWEKKQIPQVKGKINGAGKKILVIDDEEDIVTFLTTMFEDNGFKVKSTTNPAKAMEMISEYKPDLITLDVVMPEVSGTSLYKSLRENPEHSDIPIYIVSGVDLFRKFIYERPIKKPEGFIDKPIDEELILTSIAKTLAL